LFFFQLCWRENIRDNKKNIAFLLVWDKDSYTERFLVLSPWIYILQLKLVHLFIFVSMNLTILGFSDKWDPTIFVLLWLVSFE
jgi:hypothetical protein